jgi:hypothetical protein
MLMGCIAWLRRVGVRAKEVAQPAGTGSPACANTVGGRSRRRQPVLAQNVAAKLDAGVTDEDAWPGDKLPDLILAFSAKVATRGTPPIGHAESICV